MPWSDDKSGSEYRDVYILQYRVDDEEVWRTTGNYARRKADYKPLKAIIKRDMLYCGYKKVVFKITKRARVYWHGISFPHNVLVEDVKR